jgi:hypothetical protein
VSHMPRPSSLVTLLVAGLYASAGSPAHGQAPYSPNPPGMPGSPGVTQPTQQSGVVARPTAPPASYQPPPVNVNQYAPSYAPYAGVPYGNPYASGGLTGAANAINAQGEFEKQFQQARLMNQDVERSKIDTKRAKIEEWQWERNNLPTLEQNRERDQYWQLRQTLNDAPRAQIWDGSALNTILTATKQVLPPGVLGPTVYLAPGLTTQISLTTGQTNTGVGLLKNGAKLQWPYALSDDAFDKPRADVDRLMKMAYDQVTAGQVDFKVIRQLKSDLDTMDGILKAKIEEMTPTDNIHGKRYVRELRETVQALQQPDASSFFAACRPTPANTVGELVQGMSAKGQTFAPAQSGTEPAYNALYSAMVAYFNALTQPTIRGTSPSASGVGAGRPGG